MKKIMILFLTLILIVFSACEKTKVQDNVTTTNKNSDIYTETLKTTKSLPSITITSTSTTTNHTQTNTQVSSSTSSNVEEVSPYNVVDLDIKKMKSVLEVSETMGDTEFEKYLSLNYPYAHNCEFTTPERYRTFIEDVSEIPLAVVDNNHSNVDVAYYYLGNNNVTQVVYIDETHRFVVDINPLVIFEQNDNTVLKSSIKSSDFSADIYWSDTWNLYTGNIYVDNNTYTFRAYEMNELDIVEANLIRISFVKIGDLLNETTVETTLSETETVPEAETQITE